MPYEKIELSLGGKLSFLDRENDFKEYDYIGGIPTYNPNVSNLFLYEENTQAIYADVNKKIGDQWIFKGGLSLESTQTVSASVTQDETDKNNYVALFPNVFIQYKLDDKKSMVASYGRRISRAPFWMLNPSRRYVTATTYWVGNPFLKPMFVDNLNLKFSYGNNQTSFYFSRKTDGYRDLLIADNSSVVQVTRPENFITSYTYGVKQVFSLELFK